MKIKLFFIAFTMLSMVASASAEIIILDSGEKIEANVVKKDDTYVIIDYKGVTVSYYAFEVKSIDGEKVEAVPKKKAQGPNEEPSAIASMHAVSAEEYLRRGAAYYSRGNFEVAISDFNRAIKIKPDYAEAYLNRGLAEINKEDAKKAFADYDMAIQLNPKYEEAYYVRGLGYASKGKFDEAISDYTKAIELNPQYVQAYLNRGYIVLNKGNSEAAIVDFNTIIKINSSIPAVYYLRGVAYANKGNLQQGIADYGKAIELEPKYVEAYVNRALAYLYKGSLEQSKLDPNSPRAFVNIGPTYSNKADIERALSDCAKAIEVNPKYAEGYIVRSRIYLIQRDFDKAWADVHKAEELEAQINPQIIEELKRASGRDK